MDAHCCALLGLDTSEVAYLLLAQQYGAGNMAWQPDDIVFLNQPAVPIEARADGRLVRGLTRNVEQRSACSACFANLVRALYQYREQVGKDYIDRIAIGQEYRGECPDCLGIGRCCHGAERHVPGCPPNAADILRELMN